MMTRNTVRDYLDSLLDLLFAGIASGVWALPPFEKMGDRPWAHAWRRAEIRMALETGEPMPVGQMAHLLGVTPDALRRSIALATGHEAAGDVVPRDYLNHCLDAARAECCDERD